MISARLRTICPGCDEPIEPGDMIDRIGLAYVCSSCFEDWARENAAAPRPTITGYPVSSQYEPS